MVASASAAAPASADVPPAPNGAAAPASAETTGSPPPSEIRARADAPPQRDVVTIRPPPLAPLPEARADGAAPPISPRTVTGRICTKPLLASEALMEDLAPVDPGLRVARILCAALGVGFLVIGLMPFAGLRTGGVLAIAPALGIAVFALATALAPISYGNRAIAMVVLGALSGGIGLHLGDAAVGGTESGFIHGLFRLVPAIGLTAALLFRANYRAYVGARIFLVISLGLCAPVIFLGIAGLLGGFGLPQLGSVIALIAIAASLTGFMGAETTGAGTYIAYAVPVALAVELALRPFGASGMTISSSRIVEIVTAAVAFASGTGLAGLGTFQIAAKRFGPDARRINLHSRPADMPKPQDSGMWSTRE